MKPLIFALCVVFALGTLSAQKPAWSHRWDNASADMAGSRA